MFLRYDEHSGDPANDHEAQTGDFIAASLFRAERLEYPFLFCGSCLRTRAAVNRSSRLSYRQDNLTSRAPSRRLTLGSACSCRIESQRSSVVSTDTGCTVSACWK